jgi:hypothetical protein
LAKGFALTLSPNVFAGGRNGWFCQQQIPTTGQTEGGYGYIIREIQSSESGEPFKEAVKDHKRFNAVAGAEKFEDALPGFKDEKDLKGFVGWVLRGTPGYKK